MLKKYYNTGSLYYELLTFIDSVELVFCLIKIRALYISRYIVLYHLLVNFTIQVNKHLVLE